METNERQDSAANRDEHRAVRDRMARQIADLLSELERFYAASQRTVDDQRVAREWADSLLVMLARSRSVMETESPAVERAIRRAIERVPEIARARRAELTESNIQSLVDVYLADDPIAEARTSIEADNARERARYLQQVECLTSRQVAEHAGHAATNRSMTGSRWKQQKRVFSVPWKAGDLFPAFQFRDGLPHPTVAKVLRVLPDRMSPWQIAFWFRSGNSWLRGATPAERLDDEEALLAAARRKNEPIIG
jgi:hypothetical protein